MGKLRSDGAVACGCPWWGGVLCWVSESTGVLCSPHALPASCPCCWDPTHSGQHKELTFIHTFYNTSYLEVDVLL